MTGGAEVPAPRATQRIVAPDPLVEPHLADTSVWSKVRSQPALADWFNAEVRAGRIVTCGIVVLELGDGALALQGQRVGPSTQVRATDACPLGKSARSGLTE